MIESRKLGLLIRMRGPRATKDEPDAINVRCDCKKAERDLGGEQRARIDEREHRRASGENHHERRYFHYEVYAFVKLDENELLGSALAEQGSLKNRFGDDAPEPDTNAGEMQGQQNRLQFG